MSGNLNKLGAGIVAAALSLSLSACGGDPLEGEASDSQTITVGSADFGENEIIAEIYAQALESEGIEVERQLRIGAREAYIKALQNGEIDLIPEYTGNLLGYFNPEAKATSAEEVEDALEEALPEELELYDVSEAQDKDSLNVTAEFAEKNDLETIGDLKKLDGFALAANPEFKQRAYGIPGLKKVYGIDNIDFVPISDGGGAATLKALLDGDVQVADIYSTTPSIVENDLVTLKDPKNLIAAQNVVPLIRDDADTDKIESILNKISAKLTTEDLLDLNAKNQGEKKISARVLAEQWLKENGLI